MTARKLVIGIDYGTTYTGVAYAIATEADEGYVHVEDIDIIRKWPLRGRSRDGSDKVPSEIAYNRPGAPVSWGFEISEDQQPLQWVKLLLEPAGLDLNQHIPNLSRLWRSYQELTKLQKTPTNVIADYLRELWILVTEHIEHWEGTGIFQQALVTVVMTLPASWSDRARGRMLEAANMANIHAAKTSLRFRSEPEAAAIYELKRLTKRQLVEEGDCFILCDAGGGTVDLASYRILSVLKEHSLEEVTVCRGGFCGSTFVDSAFEHQLRSILGSDYDKLPTDVITEIWNKFEYEIKRTFDDEKITEHTIPVRGLPDDDDRKIRNGKLQVDHAILKESFDSVITQILQLVNDQVQELQSRGLSNKLRGILLVGGFGESDYLHTRIRQEFCDKAKIQVWRGHRSWTAVARGAVAGEICNGIRQDAVGIRFARYNYGIPYRTGSSDRVHWLVRKGQRLGDSMETEPYLLRLEDQEWFDQDQYALIFVRLVTSDDDDVDQNPSPSLKHYVDIKCRVPTKVRYSRDAKLIQMNPKVWQIPVDLVLTTDGPLFTVRCQVQGEDVGSIDFRYYDDAPETIPTVQLNHGSVPQSESPAQEDSSPSPVSRLPLILQQDLESDILTTTDAIFSLPATRSDGEYSRTSATNESGQLEEFRSHLSPARSVVSSNLTLGLCVSDNERLVSRFAEMLVQGLKTSNHLSPATGTIGSLLRDFSILLKNKASPGSVDARAASFIRTRSRAIATSFEQKHVEFASKPNPRDLPSLEAKLEMLWPREPSGTKDADGIEPADLDWSNINDDVYPPSGLDELEGTALTIEEDGLPELESSLQIPEKDAAKALEFLTSSDEFQWLLRRIQMTGFKIPTRHPVVYEEMRQTIVKCISRSEELWVELDWPVVQFAREQYEQPAELHLGSVICLIGTAETAEVTTCGEYVNRWWPNVGDKILTILTKSLHYHLKYPTLYGPHKLPQTDPSFALEVIRVDDEVYTIIIKSSNSTMLVEAGEVLCWLGAACRRAPQPDCMSYCTPSVLAAPNSGTAKVAYKYSNIDLVSARQGEDSTCWHALFRNPTITGGYPIAHRDQPVPGLQISAEMMTILSQADNATLFDGTYLIKGLYAMFVPVLKLGSALLWHYMVNKDRSWMLHNTARETCPNVVDIELAELRTATHIVGWTPSSTTLAASKSGAYDQIGYTGADFATSGLALDGAEINIGYKMVSITGKIVPGTKDTPLALKSSELYEAKMHHAELTHVVMYDKTERRAWLLDGATVLLHMLRACLSHREAFVRRLPSSRRTIANLRYPDSSFPDITTAYDSLTHPHNRRLQIANKECDKQCFGTDSETRLSQDTAATSNGSESSTIYTFENLAEHLWLILEQIKSHQALIRRRNLTNLKNPFYDTLEGWGFLDIISGDAPIFPRCAKMRHSGSMWLQFTDQCGAINILGSSFGDLIVPLQNDTNRCKNAVLLPSGMDFLAAPIQRLESIAKKHGQVGKNFLQLAKDVYWNETFKSIGTQPCTCENDSFSSERIIARRCGKFVTSLSKSRQDSTNVSKRPLRMWERIKVSKKTQKHDNVSEEEDTFRMYPSAAIIIGRQQDWKKIEKTALRNNHALGREAASSSSDQDEVDSGVDLQDLPSSNGSVMT